MWSWWESNAWSFTPLWAVDHNFFKTQNYQLLNRAFDRQCTHLSTHVKKFSTKHYWRRCVLKRYFFKFFLFKGSKPWKPTVVLETVSTLVPVLPYRQYSSREQSSISSEVSKLWVAWLVKEDELGCDPHSCTAVRVPAYVRFGSGTIRAIQFMTCLSLCLSVS